MPAPKKSCRSSKTKCSVPAKAPKAPKPPTPEAVAQVLQWLLDGQNEHSIVEAIEKHELGDKETLIAAACENLRELGQFDADAVRGFCFAAYRDLYRSMREIADFAGAIRAVKCMEDLARRNS